MQGLVQMGVQLCVSVVATLCWNAPWSQMANDWRGILSGPSLAKFCEILVEYLVCRSSLT